MMKINKIILITTFLIANVVSTNTMSQTMDSSFNYQGELLDNGTPANGQYDINVDLIDGDMNPWGNTSEHSPVEVINGLFRINVDFDIDSFDGYKDSTITVSVRKTSEGPGGAFTVLGSQTLQAVPLATNLTNGAATSGQVLTFNGFLWTPATPAGGASSPWTIAASNIYYTGGKVGVGTATPNADLNIDATSDGDVMRVRVDSATKFYIDDNGGIGVGSWTTPPIDGLQIQGDAKQPITSNGLMKYMVYASCISSATSSITRSYNGVTSDVITIASGTTGDVQCTIDFPTNINDRYWQVSPVVSLKDRGAHCILGSSNDKLNCYRYTTSTGSNNGGAIMVLVY